MSKMRGVVFLLAIAIWLSFTMPAGAAFIGTSIPLSNNIGGSIDVNLGNILAGDSSAYGLANMDLGVDWGVGYDLEYGRRIPIWLWWHRCSDHRRPDQ